MPPKTPNVTPKVLLTLTPKQKRVLDWVVNWLDTKGYGPSFVEIGAGLGIEEVGRYVQVLRAKGYLEMEQWKAVRALRVSQLYRKELKSKERRVTE